jgi:hypothetical protein
VKQVEESSYYLTVKKGKGSAKLYLPSEHPIWQHHSTHIWLRLAKRSFRAQLVVMKDNNQEPVLELGSGFVWPKRLQLKLKIVIKGDIGYVGPLVGILCRTFKRVRYGPQDTLFRRMISQGDELHIGCAVFSPGHISWKTGRMRGYRWSSGRWAAYTFPLPDVVYNRTINSSAVRAVEQGMRLRGRPVFNRRMGNKWRQYRILRNYDSIRPYLPLTRILRSTQDLQTMMARSGGAYVKPVGGAKGRGIWRVEKIGRGYVARFTDGNARVHRISSSNLAVICRAIKRKGRVYIVQPRLRLITWEGGIADIRALMQKDISGQWQVTGIGVRVGRRRSIVSNLSGGGSGRQLQPVLKAAFPHEPDKVDSILATLPVLAKQIAKILDKNSCLLGELGIDFGVDDSGRVWFIEANSRTGRSLFHRLDTNDLGRTADRRPLEYAAYLAGFGLNT